MPRVPPGSCVAEVSQIELLELVKVLKTLINRGVYVAGITLEPGIVDVEIGSQRLTIALGSPALILGPDTLCNSIPGFARVIRDAWLEYAKLDLKGAVSALESVLTCREAVVDSIRIIPYGSCTRSKLFTVETLSLKYPYRPLDVQVNYRELRNLTVGALREGKIILVAGLENEVIKPVMWVERNSTGFTLHTCCPDTEHEQAAIVKSLLDVLISKYLTRDASLTEKGLKLDYP